jgi:nitrite reductase (NADH) large subunit
VHYFNRVGMDYIKQRVLDDTEGRHELHERMVFALQVEKDPWVERAKEGVLKHEFEMLAV